MKTATMTLCVCALGIGIFESSATAAKGTAYLDFLTVQAAGEFRSQSYDVYSHTGGDDHFVGNLDLAKGTFLGGGLGLRLAYTTKIGIRVSGEGAFSGGRLVGIDAPWLASSTVLRGELLSGLGYQFATGPLAVHLSFVFGADYQSFRVPSGAFARSAVSVYQGFTPSVVSPIVADPDDYKLSRWGLRVGGQIGTHVQIAELIALFGDATFDYDGQWRARIGLSVGNTGRR